MTIAAEVVAAARGAIGLPLTSKIVKERTSTAALTCMIEEGGKEGESEWSARNETTVGWIPLYLFDVENRFRQCDPSAQHTQRSETTLEGLSLLQDSRNVQICSNGSHNHL